MNDMFRVLLCGILCAVAGCSSGSSPTLAKADGVVTYQGKPVPNATVMFLPENGMLAMGMTDEQGKFTMSSGGRPGVALGSVKVSITANIGDGGVAGTSEIAEQPETPEESAAYMKKAEEMQKNMATGQMPAPKAVSLIPEKYGFPERSGLSYTIKADGDNHFEIKLD